MSNEKSEIIAQTKIQIEIMTQQINIIAEMREECAYGKKSVSIEKMEDYIMWNDVLGKYGNARYSMQMAIERLENRL